MGHRTRAKRRGAFHKKNTARIGLLFYASAVAFATGGASAVFADSDYDPKGLPLGAFRLFPTMPVTAAYDDNVYRTETDVKSDALFTIAPELSLQSQWSEDMLELDTGLTAFEYASLSDEDHVDWNVGGKGRLDILRGADVLADVSYLSTHELRGDPNQADDALKPTPYSQLHGDITFEDQPTSFGVSGGAIFDDFSYEPTLLPGGASQSNLDRNEDVYDFWAKAGYEFSPGYAVFVRGDYNEARYDLTRDRNGLDRDAQGYTVNSGLDMLVTDVIKGQVFVGYLSETYLAPFTDVSGIDFGAGVQWQPTSLVTVKLNATRALTPTVIVGASTEDDRHVDGEVDYAVLEDFTVQGFLGYTDSVFAGSARIDQTVDTWIGLKYLMNRNINATLRYEYSDRSSTLAGQNYSDQIIMLGLNLQE